MFIVFDCFSFISTSSTEVTKNSNNLGHEHFEQEGSVLNCRMKEKYNQNFNLGVQKAFSCGSKFQVWTTSNP